MRIHAALLSLLAAACASPAADERPNLPANLAVDPHPRLTTFTSCDELERYIEEAQILRMRSDLEAARLGRGPLTADGAGVVPTQPPAAAPGSHTTTNAQVEGVLEADVVQNDGTRIAALAGGALRLLRSWPPEALAEASSLAIEGWPHHLFLDRDRVVVFSAVALPRDGGGAPVDCAVGARAALAPDVDCWFRGEPAVKLTSVDVSDLTAPRILAELYLPGGYVSARLIGDRIRLVTTADFFFPGEVGFWPELDGHPTRTARASAFVDLADRNEALIRAARLDRWLPPGTLRRPGQADEPIAWDCTAFRHGAGAERPGYFSVTTVDIDGLAAVDRTSVFAAPSTVYASARTLYVASPHWYWWPEPGQRSATYLHAFDVSDPDRATYAGSGVVDGRVTDPYGLDEQGDHLRVVTTTEERAGATWTFRTAGRLSVLARAGGELRLAGRTDEFGAGEQVFAARLLGTRGFVITAAQVDPLFALDLSDPAKPTVLGELEMPGFVSYLHPVDETHLLGIGLERVTATEPTRVKVALFDVSAPALPREVSRVTIGDAGTWGSTTALWDPKAFTWFGDRKLLAIPYASWGPGLVSELRLFQVDPAQGIAPAGILPMTDVFAGTGDAFGWYWSPVVTRSILADDFVYAVSDAGVRAARVPDLPGWLATVIFPEPDLP